MAFGNALAFPFHRSRLSAAVEWTPANLFLDGEAGGWYDPTYQAEGDDYPLWQTVAAEDEADAVGDPIGLYLSNPRANEEDFSQATSAARPTLGLLTKNLGIINLVSNSMVHSSLTGATATPVTGEFIDGTDTQEYAASLVAENHQITRTFSGVSSTTKHVYGLWFEKPAGSDTGTIYLRARAGAHGVGARFTYGTGLTPSLDSLINPFGTDAPPALSISDVIIAQHPTKPSYYFLGFYGQTTTSGSTASTTQMDFRFIPVGGGVEATVGNVDTKIRASGWTVNRGSTLLEYQRVSAPYDRQVDGLPSVLMPYYDGGDHLSLGKPALSDGCSLFADVSQKWAVGGAYCSLSFGGTMFSCTAAGTGKLRVFLNSSGLFSVICRSTATGVAGTNRADGKWRSWLLVWDGAVLRLYLDNIATPITVTVGTDVEQPTAVPAIGVNNLSSPVGYFVGFNDLLLMRSGEMTSEQIEHWREYVNDKYGVA